MDLAEHAGHIAVEVQDPVRAFLTLDKVAMLIGEVDLGDIDRAGGGAHVDETQEFSRGVQTDRFLRLDR